MFFASPGEYEPCGIFTAQHFILLGVTIVAVIIALKYTMKKKKTRKIIKNCTIFVCAFELIIMGFKITTGEITNVNNYLPLYYCSLLIYAGILSSFTTGELKRTGDVFLATGGIVGGTVFLIYPSTSLPKYPMLHLVSMYSFIFHGIMIYLGVLIQFTDYIKIEAKDIKYYASLVGVICIIAYIVNRVFDGNLMFISKNFPGTIIEVFYNLTGKWFTPFMIIGQATVPFYFILGVKKLIEKRKKKIQKRRIVFDCIL